MVSSSYTDALYVPAGSAEKTVTVKNATWSGRNYYGVICVYDDTANAKVTTVLSGVTYHGPQPAYNRYGTTVAENCTFNVEKNGASVAPQEFCEANRLVFKQKVVINAQTESNAIIWFPFAGAALTVEENADVTINALKTYLVYSDSAAKPAFVFKQGSTTTINVKSGMFYSAGTGAHIASSISIESGAALSVVSSQSTSVPVVKCAGALTVAKGGSLKVVSAATSSAAALYFSVAAKATFTEPRNLLLYSGGEKVFSFATGTASAPNVITLNAAQINFWQTAKIPYASAGGLSDVPLTALKKANGTLVSVTENTTSSAFISLTSNLIEGDTGYPLPSANFDLTKAAVLSAGDIDLSVDRVTDLSSYVTGLTESAAELLYSNGSETADGKAYENGAYEIAINRPAVDATVSVRAAKGFLTTEKSVVAGGSVSVTDLPDVPFNAFAVPYYPGIVNRRTDWALELTDTRPLGGKWTLYVTLESPLSSSTTTVDDAVVFTENERTTVITATPLMIKTGVTTGPGKIRISWEEAEGVLLSVAKDAVYDKGVYRASLKWYADYE